MSELPPPPRDAATSSVDEPGTGADSGKVVNNFLYALRDKDFDGAEALLNDDVVYENVGLPTVHGSRRTMSLIRGMDGRLAFDIVIHRSAAEGATVLNERTDALTVGPVRVQFWVCGVFEVHDGRIVLWRDYFDAKNAAGALFRGLAGAVVPALRPRF